MADEPDISTMTPQQATERLAQMKAAYDGAGPSENPTTAAEAGARLDVLRQDPQRSARLFAGDVQVRREFDHLTRLVASGDKLADALAGVEPPMNELTSGKELNARNLQSAVQDLRELGLGDQAIRDTLTDTASLSVEDVALAMEFKQQALGNEEFVRRYFRGDPEMVAAMTRANAIIINGAKKWAGRYPITSSTRR